MPLGEVIGPIQQPRKIPVPQVPKTYAQSYAQNRGVPYQGPGNTYPTPIPRPGNVPGTAPVVKPGWDAQGRPIGGMVGPPSPTPANTQAVMLDSWLKQQQSGLWSNTVNGIAQSTLMNKANNTALQNSANNQLGLNQEGAFRNDLAMQQLGVADTRIDQERADTTDRYNANQGYLDQQWQLRNGQWQSQAQYIRDIWGITTQQHVADQGYFEGNEQRIKSQYGYNDRDLAIRNEQTALAESINKRSAQSDAAGRGAYQSSGFAQNLNDIAKQAELGYRTNRLGFDERNTGIEGSLADAFRQRGAENLDYQASGLTKEQQLAQGYNALSKDQSTYLHSKNINDMDQKSAMQQFDAQLEDNTFARQGLESIAREYGIRAKDINETLMAAVQKNNLNLAQVVFGINKAYQSGNQQLIQQTNQFITGLIGAQ